MTLERVMPADCPPPSRPLEAFDELFRDGAGDGLAERELELDAELLERLELLEPPMRAWASPTVTTTIDAIAMPAKAAFSVFFRINFLSKRVSPS